MLNTVYFMENVSKNYCKESKLEDDAKRILLLCGLLCSIGVYNSCRFKFKLFLYDNFISN